MLASELLADWPANPPVMRLGAELEEEEAGLVEEEEEFPVWPEVEGAELVSSVDMLKINSDNSLY